MKPVRLPPATTGLPQSILLVDDDPSAIQLLARILAGVSQLRFATNGEDALRLASELAPDLILLDAEMPGLSGFQVLERLKADKALADVPVIFVTSHLEPALEVLGFEMGAADFIVKPVSPPLVLARVKTQLRVKSMADELRRIACTDELTGVANRRHFDESLAREWRNVRRFSDPLALLMIDVDHFKLYNDRYGHQAGDTCLRAVAQALKGACMRPDDLVACYGGEEFVMLLPRTAMAGSERVAHDVLDAVAALKIKHAASPTAGQLSVSVGVACYDETREVRRHPTVDSRGVAEEGHGAADLVRAADLAMYAAKHAGRARAWLLDLESIDSPELAREIAPPVSGAGKNKT